MPDCFVASPLLAGIPGVTHAFSTRQGGTSKGAFASLNLAFGKDDPVRVRDNRATLRAAAKLWGPWVEVNQVHGATVVEAQEVSHRTEADAIVVPTPGPFAAIRTADCVPLLLAALDAARRPRAVAAVHAGWRGAAAGVVPATLDRLRKLGHPPGALVAAIGPSISVQHFEVGPEVLEAAAASMARVAPRGTVGSTVVPHRMGPGRRPHLDLVGLVSRQLEASGVPADRIDVLDACTYRNADRYFSYRRQNGSCGHHLSLIGFTP